MCGLWNRCNQVGSKDVIVEYPLVVVEAAPDTICQGLSILTASGVDSYLWNLVKHQLQLQLLHLLLLPIVSTGTKYGLTSSGK